MTAKPSRSEEIALWFEKLRAIDDAAASAESQRARLEVDREEAADYRRAKREAVKQFELERLTDAANRARIAARRRLNRDQVNAKNFGGAAIACGTLNPLDLRFISNPSNVNGNTRKATLANLLLQSRRAFIEAIGHRNLRITDHLSQPELDLWYRNLTAPKVNTADQNCLLEGDREWYDAMNRYQSMEAERRKIVAAERREFLALEMVAAKTEMEQAQVAWFQQVSRIVDMTYEEMVDHDATVKRAECDFHRRREFYEDTREQMLKEIGSA